MNQPPIGIDLGTTLSAIAYVDKEGIARVIPNKFGKNLTPSVFSIDQNNNIYIGDEAIIFEKNNIINTIRSIKRIIGTPIKKQIYDREYSPEEISGYILSNLKSYAEEYLNTKISKVVITVPAYFNNDQRKSTKDAGAIAKLDVLQIINEPTAAALAYGLGTNKNEKIIVFDLGGGTFDVTILNITSNNVFDVLSTSGDTALGGDDFDNQLIDYFISCMNINSEASNIPLIRAILRNIAEETKIKLSTEQEIYIQNKQIKIINDVYTLDCRITREQFNKMIDKYLNKCKNCMNFALRDSGLKTYKEIDKIILVGGSTRVPYVREKIQEWTGITPDASINPDEAVALGASIQASLLMHSNTQSAVLLDVTPLTLGIEAAGGMMIPMIKRNTTIPVDHEEIFSTAEDNQDCVAIKIFQGERPRAEDNKCIGSFKLEGIKPAPRGEPQILVTFSVDMNGIVSVMAKDEDTCQYKQLTITGSSNISQEEMDRILLEAERYREEDKIIQEKFIIIKKLQDRLVQISKLLETSNDIINTTERTKLEYYSKIIEEEDLLCRDVDNLYTLEKNIENIMDKISNKLKIKAKNILEKHLIEQA